MQTLADVVSKNGNLLLSVPVRGDGTIDSDEVAVVEEIGAWMAINKEAIYGTRPWKTFGEGPAIENAAPLTAQGFNEGKGKPFEAADIRFTTKGNALYAIPMIWPENGKITIKNLKTDAKFYPGRISKVMLLGNNAALAFTRDNEGLQITLPTDKPLISYAFALKIS